MTPCCRFIGELFKLKMLTENIMRDCVFRLLKARDEDSLECLCRLLATIGKDLEDKARVCTVNSFMNVFKEGCLFCCYVKGFEQFLSFFRGCDAVAECRDAVSSGPSSLMLLKFWYSLIK
jgi:hypothetical protein